jgi:hypothetical protein
MNMKGSERVALSVMTFLSTLGSIYILEVLVGYRMSVAAALAVAATVTLLTSAVREWAFRASQTDGER